MPDHVVIPNVRAIARHSLPNMVEGKIIPVLLFLGFLETLGQTWALIVALVWSLAAIGYRKSTNRRVPGLIVLSAVALVAKTIAALATGSLVVYFLQPTITTALVGIAFFVSVPLGSPLAERLAHDLCPFDEDTRSHPHLRRFFIRLSLLWSVTSLINASITLWLLLTQSPTTFVLVKSFLGPATTSLTLLIGLFWFRSIMSRAGTRVVYSPRMVPAPVPALAG